ncbi:MAG TPA: arsenite S-adenosylmethyltransferase [Bacteroidetes bacterium]|nr:arsenite S-adenosylmethyltransferase [Bacteroidota bacterium]
MKGNQMEIIIELKTSTCCSEIKTILCCESEPVELNDEGVKEQVRSRYAETATTGGGCGCSAENPFNLDSYDEMDGYESIVDLGLGCGIPTEQADIMIGHDVLDLGSGGGIDAFVARTLVGPTGSVTGVDLTDEMVSLARLNADKLGYDNVRFLQGDIENLPFEDASFDRIISNCVINLVPNKEKVFAEMHRALRLGGSFTVSDVVLDGELPPAIRQSAEAYAGCVSGAVTREDYLNTLKRVGFFDVQVLKEHEVVLSDADLAGLASPDEIAQFRNSGARVVSLTFTGSRT